jgi:hypothetical protein
MTTKKTPKRYTTGYACIPDFLPPSYAILAEDVGAFFQAEAAKAFYKQNGHKSKIIKVEIREI